MNLLIFVGKSVLDLSKTLIYKFYYDYMILKWSKATLIFLHMDTGSRTPLIEAHYFYKYIAGNVEK